MSCKGCAAAHKLARQLAGDMGQIVKKSVVNWTFLSASRSEERLKVCATCDELDRHRGVCRACGCFVRAKSMLTQADCPKAKWPII